MDMKKAFVGLGIGVLVVTGLIQSGVIDVNQVFTKQSVSSESNGASNQTTASQATQQPGRNESEWVKVNEKTCEVAWNNQDFKNGWCPLGRLSPGEYRFKIKSGLSGINTDGSLINYPAEGLPAELGHTPSDAEIIEKWSPIRNRMSGMAIFKVDNEYPTSKWEISLSKPQIVLLSLNYPPTEDNWKALGFRGKITVEILKKKSEMVEKL